MCDKERLVSYLYDDLGDAERVMFETHLRECAECRDELSALRGVRADLISWSPPQPDFGFRVVREPKVLPFQPRSWRAWLTPAAGLAAAAVLVLAAAAAIAHVEIRRGPGGVTVRTGWSAFAPGSGGSEGGMTPQSQVRQASAPAVSNAIDPAALAALERRINVLEASAHDASGVRNASMLSARSSDAEILRRVRELLAQSETKQQGQLALRVAQVLRDVEAQRVADLSRIQQGMRGIEASVSAEAQGHRELTNYILASSKQK
ncbi:MAG TPA: zf-HC2 domain-containing protein [Vicinamibacterales bacterium]|nr:zf-HC2 domain-containing protein [Vicinamibacterales bacterium]